MDIQKAVQFVRHNGSEIEKFRLDYALGRSRSKELPLRYLEGLQNSDGGFPYGDVKGNLSSLNSTSGKLGLIIELGLTSSEPCAKAVRYLLGIQREDGGWDEDAAITRYNPPFFDIPGDTKTRMWLTAEITRCLIELGYQSSVAVRKANEFLLRNRDEEGKFLGFLASTWISIPVFAMTEGTDSEVVKKCLEVLERNMPKIEDDASDLVWCLECLYSAGISRTHPLVERCLAPLPRLQREDGAWTSADGEVHTVSTTISVVRMMDVYEAPRRART